MRFPDQITARLTLSHQGDPYASQDHRKILRSLSQPHVLACSHCGFLATQDQIREFHNTQDPSVGSAKINMDVLAEGWGLFRALPEDFNPWSTDPKNFRLVCEVCFHAGHILMPGFEPSGKFGLVAVMSQSEIVQAWRAMMLAATCGKHRAAQAKEALRSFSAGAEAQLNRELKERGGTAIRVTNVDVAYWLAYSKPEIHAAAAKVIPDLRLIPSVELSSYGIHLAFCQRFAPLFPPASVPQAPSTAVRVEPMLERTSTV